MKKEAVGLIEMNSIASGILVTDVVLDTAEVEIVLSRTICSGKYLVVFSGSVAAVQSAVDAGREAAEGGVIDFMVIANVHPAVFPAIAGANTQVVDLDALGVVESFSVGSLIEAADAIAKAAAVDLLEIRLAMALGGKAFVTFTGDVSSVTEAAEVGASVIAAIGFLVNKVVIPAPHPQLYKDYL